MSSKLMTILQSQEISVFRNVRFAIAILAIGIVILLSIIRRRARSYARWLETGALSLLQSNADGPMVRQSPIIALLHLSVIRCAQFVVAILLNLLHSNLHLAMMSS